MKSELQLREIPSAERTTAPADRVAGFGGAVVSARPASGTALKPPRITAIDFTKGALVLIMVLYHWINYFIGADWPYYFYLRFLTPSFIFVSGFVVANVYLARSRPGDTRPARRLFSRGMKLLAVFVALNVVRSLLLPILSSSAGVGRHAGSGYLTEIFVSGNVSDATGKLVAFYILVPISYLLLLSALLLQPQRRFRYTFHVAALTLLSCVVVLDVYGFRSYNLEYVTIGFFGVVAGLVPLEKVNRAISHPWLLAVAYLCYLAAITVWNVPFGLLVPGVALSVGVIYWFGLQGGQPGMLRGHVILLGKYSLFGYVAQIAILQFLSAGLRHWHSPVGVPLVSIVAAFVLTSASVEAVDRLRLRSGMCDRAYRFVFA